MWSYDPAPRTLPDMRDRWAESVIMLPMLSATGALLASQQGDAVLLILGLIFVPVGLLLLWAA
jgi:uncharacterized membrane protein